MALTKGIVAVISLIHVKWSIFMLFVHVSLSKLCLYWNVFIFEGGTMYYASTLINRVLISTASITIVDGQNELAIANLQRNDYNPCLPETMHSDKVLTITFLPNITRFGDWFHPNCRIYTDYSNEYMFDGAQTWNIHNLIVENYVITDGYGLVRTESYHGEIACTQCLFINIQNAGSVHLFETWGSFHFGDSKFIEITLDGSYLVNADHYSSTSGGNREFVITETNFVNITTPDHLIYFHYSWNDVKY